MRNTVQRQPRSILRWWAAFASGLVLAMANHGAASRAPRTPVPLTLPTMLPPAASDRVLVVAPHPDDETLCCAGYLQQARQAGATVAIVWITAGDSFEFDAIVTERTLRPKGAGLEKLGVQRIAEAHAAADRLGVARDRQYVLGFPDRDLETLLRAPDRPPLRSRYTGVSAVPYAEALHPGSVYTGVSLRANLQQVIDEFAPTIVLMAAPQDRHPDHSASGALALQLARSRLPKARLYYWIVHGGRQWPAPRGLHPSRYLPAPRVAAALAWQQLPLTTEQVAGKLRALREHQSQLKVMSRFLEAFVRANEIYAPAP